MAGLRALRVALSLESAERQGRLAGQDPGNKSTVIPGQAMEELSRGVWRPAWCRRPCWATDSCSQWVLSESQLERCMHWNRSCESRQRLPRIGVDGLNPPVGAITPTLPIPVSPGVNAPYATLVESLDQAWRPARTDSIDFSIQRQLKGNMILEVGYVGTWYANNLYQGIDFGNVPYMMKLGGQVVRPSLPESLLCAAGCRQDIPAAPQPFLEAALVRQQLLRQV